MPKKIEKDLEELSVNIFVNEYGSLRNAYNRLYAIIHVYYSGRRQLAASEDTISLEKLLQMRKDIAMRLERINILMRDQQFPQDNFAEFAKEKLKKMYVAIGVMETASLIGELSTYSATIMDYMKSCCTFATKFITILSDPGNQNLQALKSNLSTFLEQIDALIQQRWSSEKVKATASLKLVDRSPREASREPPAVAHADPDPSHGSAQSALTEEDSSVVEPNKQQEAYFVAIQENAPSPLVFHVYEALNILEKIDLFRSKSRPLKADENSPGANDAREIVVELREEM
jgi:hypothetical protein